MINIIGAGPAGLYAAYLLAREGKEVNVFEEHDEIGSPVHCTGIVTSSILDIVSIKKEAIVNKVKAARVFSPEGKFSDFNLKNENLILDRKRFEQDLAANAKKAGANIFLESKFLGLDKDKVIIEDKKSKKIKKLKSGILIGADGPNSGVAKSCGMYGERDFYIGIQARVRIKNNPDIFEVHLGKVAPGFFAWLVPEDEKTARVGLAVKNNPAIYLDRLLKDKKIKNKDIIEKQGGLIPVYRQGLKIKKNNAYLVGDSACQVKATTGGGLVHGLSAAKILADCISNGRDYEKTCNQKISKDLWMALKIRQALNKFSDEDYNRLISILSKEENKRIIEELDRDYPSKFALRLLLKEPSLMLFATKLF